MTKYVKVRIKWPEGVPPYLKFRHYTMLKNMVAADDSFPPYLAAFEWIDTGMYFPDYVRLQEEDAIMYTLSA